MSWKYTDQTNTVVFRVNDNGTTESCVVEAIGDWIAQGNAPLPADAPDHNIVIQSQIDEIERSTLMNRGCREGWIALIQQQGAAAGLTNDQLLVANIFYRKLIDTDSQVRALRAQLT